jgi:hydrogenase maturation protease
MQSRDSWWNERIGSPRTSEAGARRRDGKRCVVLGVGNLLFSDEGVGVHVAQRLMKYELPGGVEVVEGGTDGFGLMGVVATADRLIVVDAVKGGSSPGSIYRFEIEDCPPFPDSFKTSVHQVSILEVIVLSGLVGQSPRTVVIGVEPKCLEMSMTLSDEVEAKIPEVIESIMQEIGSTLPTCDEGTAGPVP